MTQTAERTAPADRTNRLAGARAGGQLVADYWDNLFAARDQGKQIVWYNGGALNPIFQAAGLAWCHGEAFAARIAAPPLPGPAPACGAQDGHTTPTRRARARGPAPPAGGGVRLQRRAVPLAPAAPGCSVLTLGNQGQTLPGT